MGLGAKKASKPFVNACDVFVYTENLVDTEKKTTKSRTGKKSTKEKTKPESDPMPILEQAFDMAVQEDGWARLDVMGSNLYQLAPGTNGENANVDHSGPQASC